MTVQDIKGTSVTDVADMDTLRANVQEELPELEWISNPDLREKVVAAWALALSETEYRRISDIPPEGYPGHLILTRGTQADHMRGVTKAAVAMADAWAELLGDFGINRDILIAGALVHDCGKPFEFSQRNRERWEADSGAEGLPAVRHPVYGVHIAASVGLPIQIIHIVGGHSIHNEGSFITPSRENIIVQWADAAFWYVLERAGVVIK